MSYQLRYYQEDAVRHTFDYINKGGKAGIAALPTASGKSVVIAEIIKRILMKKNHVRVMMLTHVKELISQNLEKIKSVWPTCPVGIYSAGIGFRQFNYPIVYGGIQSCYKKPRLFGHIDLLFIDECHLVSDKAQTMYGSMIAGLKEKNPNLVVIGLTATPYRMGIGLLTNGPIFTDVYYDITAMDDFVKLIDEGYLCDLIPIRTDNQIDVSNIKKAGGEFTEKSLDENVNRDEITKEIVLETISKAADRRKGITFCVSKSHAENMSLRFNEAGISCTFIHSDLTNNERNEVLRKYATGEVSMITNVGVLTTGFDAPDIDYMVIARPTESASLHVQIMGRGMRVHPSKQNTLVLDFAGNTIRLGPVNDPVIPVPKGEEGGLPPIRVCEECGTINHAAAKICKGCGFVFPPAKLKFSGTVQTTELIRRSDVPKITIENVTGFVANPYTSVRGNETVKLSIILGTRIVDSYFTFDRHNPKACFVSMKNLKKLKFKEPIPEFANTSQALDFIKENLIKPDAAKLWLNKSVQGENKKKIEILDYIYGAKEDEY